MILCNQTVANLPAHVAKFSYDRAQLSQGIVHFGVGNFHRTHMAVYVDRCLARGECSWAIMGVGLQPGGETKAEAYHVQDGLYTVTEYAADGAVSTRVIGAMTGYLNAMAEPEAVLAAIAARDTKILSFTITEGGYNLNEETGAFDLGAVTDLNGPPRSVFRFVVEGLQRRRKAGLGGLTLMSCDNLRSNGTATRKAFLTFARAFDPETAAWMEDCCAFPNSMVDRIAPKVGPVEAARANEASGIDDLIPAIAEDFLQWVIEDNFAAGRPEFEKVGVQLRPDVHAFEAIKGRMLNGAHVIMSYPAVLMGHRLVDGAMADHRIRALLTGFLNRIAIPLISPPNDVSLTDYREMILKRFSNPAVGDQILRLAQDGVSKLPTFLSATTRETLEKGTDPAILAYHLACFRQYFTGRDDSGACFEVREPRLADSDLPKLAGDPLVFLSLAPLAALRLQDNTVFVAAYLDAVRNVQIQGAGKAFEALFKGPS